ncbi:hypothetical protein VFPPC_16980 [Pochonia chlamydosporia 170]|uniref:Uncharacterized protein n=1 Tax=Pochonia chlamydosporia 170 TaxID=1380566 RepID=A0A179EZ02_METCM|nr:hypothetical protein VFPPC_16980 [Pochonia chlamydosporia 170]OAQ58424.1 hypothetical protein VFPPC_16980 [Pochonia chlamydosporia 170]
MANVTVRKLIGMANLSALGLIVLFRSQNPSIWGPGALDINNGIAYSDKGIVVSTVYWDQLWLKQQYRCTVRCFNCWQYINKKRSTRRGPKATFAAVGSLFIGIGDRTPIIYAILLAPRCGCLRLIRRRSSRQ